MRNQLLNPEPPPTKDPRCTGRTTAIALSAIAKAIDKQGHSVYARDHFPGPIAAVHLRGLIIRYVEKLGLKHFTVDVVCSGGQYDDYVRLKSDIWAVV